MTQRERQLLSWIQENPLISQQELADKAGITRSSVAVHISNLMRKGHILGKGYLLKEQEYVVGIGAANVDVHGRSKAPINLRDSNPGHMNVYGSELIASYLGKYICEHFDIEKSAPGSDSLLDGYLSAYTNWLENESDQ